MITVIVTCGKTTSKMMLELTQLADVTFNNAH